MPSVTDNLKNWTADWTWSQRGDEWSAWWGGTPAMWHAVLLPRIHLIVPTGSILEIAPGYGRWTQYLKDLCDHLVVVDLTPGCIEQCRTRFKEAANITYHVNDGKSLDMIEDGSVDFAFSFDSLVHADPEVIGEYLRQLARKLTPDGVGFVHHSNAGALGPLNALSRRIPGRALGPLMRRGIAVNVAAWRDERMSAKLFRSQCERSGLACISQELVSWEFGLYMIDSFSMFTLPGSRFARPMRLIRNPWFVAEARRMAGSYASASFRPSLPRR